MPRTRRHVIVTHTNRIDDDAGDDMNKVTT